jgi:enterochelin esterase-like enzyme
MSEGRWGQRSSRGRQALVVVGALLLPGLFLWLWDVLPLHEALVATLISLELDRLRALVLVELLGIFVAALLAALPTRGILVWPAAGAWFALLFAVWLPTRLPPRALPFEVVDWGAVAIVLCGLIGMGVAAAGLGAGAGSGLRMAARLLFGRPRARSVPLLAVGLAGLVLLAPSVYGVVQAPALLTNSPWQGVTKPAAAAQGAAAGLSAARRVDFSYHSSAFGTTRRAVVDLPAGYDGSPQQRYPVVYLLHGTPGTVNDWNAIGASDVAAAAHAQGRSPSLILVLVDGVGPRGGAGDSFADGYVPGESMESDILGSLIPAVDGAFRTQAERAHRGVAGYSTGGYGAANLALRHPDRFSLAVVLSVDPLEPEPDSFGRDTRAQAANDPLKLAERPAPPNAPDFFVSWGRGDAAAPDSEKFVAALQAHGYAVQADRQSGGHTGDVWKAGLYDALLSQGSRLGNPHT